MRELDINVNELVLEKQGDYNNIVRGTDNYLVLSFHFDLSWRNRRKVVHMEDVEGNYYNCTIPETNKVKVPMSITGTSRILVRVYGKEGTTTVSTNTLMIYQD